MKRLTAICVIVSPLIFLIANVLHPKEYRRNHELQQLQVIHEHYTRWQLAHFLTFISIMLFVFAIVGLAWILYERRRWQALFGGALGLCGLVAIGGVLALDGFTWAALGQVYGWPSVDRHTVVLALHAVQQSHWNLPFYIGSVAWLIGLVILAWGLIAERLVPIWAGWTFGVGGVLVGIDPGAQNNAYFIVAAAVLAVGGIGVGLALRHDDISDSTSIGNLQTG